MGIWVLFVVVIPTKVGIQQRVTVKLAGRLNGSPPARG